MSRVIHVTLRIKAVQFTGVEPWPAGVDETWAAPPACDPPVSALHRMRQANADQEVMNLHCDGFPFYWWDDVRGHGYGLKPGYWIITTGDHRGTYTDKAFRARFSEVP